LKINNAIKIAAIETDKVIQLNIQEVKAMIAELSKPMERKVADIVAENEVMARQNENYASMYRKCLS
jgi:FtsZ-binding cell division protein ZapB